MDSYEHAILRSALTVETPYCTTDEVLAWLGIKAAELTMEVKRTSMSELDGWSFESDTGNLIHQSGRFFSIEGLRVSTNWGAVPRWDQPIIHQPEVGYLGILCKNIDGVMYFLLRAKAEPGNVNGLQLSPTLQATRSNYTRAHGGSRPEYLEYFNGEKPGRVVLDQLQSEQGSRFLRKRNRNLVIETDSDIPGDDNCRWLTLAQIQVLLESPNIINMDARTVIACLDFGRVPDGGADLCNDILACVGHSSPYHGELFASAVESCRALHTTRELISWITEMKSTYDLSVERIGLHDVEGWVNEGTEIRHESGKYFSVIGVDVSMTGREVQRWTQPLLRSAQKGLIVFLLKSINGVFHFLVQGKLEAGNFDIVEMAPSVQCINDDYRHSVEEQKAPFLDYVLSAKPEQRIYDALQSEEGGRFYHEQNRYMIIVVDDDFPIEIPDRFVWMTLRQIKEFIQYNNYFNIEARNLVAAVSFL